MSSPEGTPERRTVAIGSAVGTALSTRETWGADRRAEVNARISERPERSARA